MQDRRRVVLLAVTLVLSVVLLMLVLVRPGPAPVTPVVVPSAATMLWSHQIP